ncbi:MAG: hypothetical protein HFJ93_00635 [Muribaculaceae bacterium]|nr:hypothetical protein [Muribaculaceae bacterium]
MITYFAEWLIIISAVVATFAIGFCLNHFALRRQTCTPLRQTRQARR